MLDPNSGKWFPINTAPIHGNPSAPTRWRWRLKGINGVKLESVVVGGRVFVSELAITKFIEGTTAAHSRQPVPLRSPAARERAIRKAELELSKAGI